MHTSREDDGELPRRDRDEQARLALVELARLERQIRALEPRVRDDHDREQLGALRACRLALLGLIAKAARDVPLDAA
jgi:hypothetical protein